MASTSESCKEPACKVEFTLKKSEESGDWEVMYIREGKNDPRYEFPKELRPGTLHTLLGQEPIVQGALKAAVKRPYRLRFILRGALLDVYQDQMGNFRFQGVYLPEAPGEDEEKDVMEKIGAATFYVMKK